MSVYSTSERYPTNTHSVAQLSKSCSSGFFVRVGDGSVREQNRPLREQNRSPHCVMPCPYGINIPGIFKFYNDNITAGTYVKSKDQEHYARARRKYLLAYNEAIPTVRQADHCIACRRCERDCPQNIRIPDELRRID